MPFCIGRDVFIVGQEPCGIWGMENPFPYVIFGENHVFYNCSFIKSDCDYAVDININSSTNHSLDLTSDRLAFMVARVRRRSA